jgi:amino acid adenylation domain-containing protein
MPLRKDMEVERFEDILKKIVSRHEGLRTSFKMVQEEPVQVLHDKVEVKIIERKTRDSAIGEIKRNFSRPFDLAKAPLFRVVEIEINSGDVVLLFDLHHIIIDGVSQNILTEEFMALYLAKELPALRIQYKDYAAWRKNQEQLDLIKSRQAYWVNVFSGELPVLNLPFDYVRPVVQSKAGAMVSFALSKEKSRLIKKIAAKNNVTLYMVLLALLNVLLSKLSGDEDIIIGTPVSARQFPELDRIIGIFLNTLSMRNFPKGERTFDDFLRDVKTRTLAAYENQDYQFEDLVAGLSLVRDTGRNPIFDVMFNLMKQEEFEGDLSLLETDTFKHIKSSSKFDLNFKVVEMGEVIFFQLGYCTGLFKPETIDRIILCFKRVILELSKKPDLRLAEVEIMSQEEKNRILTQFNDTAGDYPQNRNVHGLFEDRVTRTPECIALTFEDKKLTYKELNARAEALAKYLIAKGVGRGMIVGMLQNRSAEIMIALYGILKTGGAYLPLDPDHPVKRLQYILKESSAEIVLTDNASYKSPEIEFIDIGDKAICGHRGIEPVSSPSSEDAAYVTYTSGSTGNPKGVVIEHRNIVNFIEAINRTISFSAGDRVLSLTTVSFDIFGLETLHPLTKGAMVIIGNREEQIDSRLFSRIMNREQVTVFQVTPSRLKYLLSDHKTTVSLGLLKNLLIGGEELPVGLLEKVKGVKAGKIYNLYGPTETTIWSSIKEISRDEFVSIGRPVLNTRISIFNKSLGLEPIGAAGEIYIGGEGLAAGYLNNSELTGERFINDPYRSGSKLYRTGDLGRWMPDGNIECLGRVDFQVKIRGYRIEPGEIENHLMELPFIEEALVVDRLGADGERYLCSYIVMNHDKKEASIEREDGAAKAGNDAGNINNKIRRYLSNHLPGYMIPSYFVILENIPLTPNGKIDRKKLPEPEVGTGRDYEAPRNEIEEKLIEIWSEVLNVKKEAIGLDTNFFEIGGNSLKILNVERQIRDKLHKEISIIDLFIHSTIRLIGDYLKKGKQELIVIDEDRKAIVKKGKNKLKEKRKKREAGKIV